jgi:uncharacterized protein (TIGR02246 family)
MSIYSYFADIGLWDAYVSGGSMISSTPAPGAAGLSAELRTEIAAVPARMVEAWAAHDAEAFAELFAEDGSLILPGVYKKGREEIQRFMEAGYAGSYKGTRVTGKPLEIKPLAEGAVALVTVGGVLARGEAEVSSKEAIRASWILIRGEGRWELAVYQNCPRDPA